MEHFSSCVDLFFTNQPNLIRDPGMHPTLHPKPHHQIIYSKVNLKIEYPLPYTPEISGYSKDETDLLNRSIGSFDRPKLFLAKGVHEQVILFNKTVFNSFHNFIPNKLIRDDKDPPWMNGEIKILIKKKN